MSVYEGIMRGLNEAIEHVEGKNKEQVMKEIERAIDFIEKMQKDRFYAGNHDAHSVFRTSLAALREKLEREKGCVWCKEDNKVFHDGQHFHMFCSYCGKRLEIKHEAD